MLKSENFFTVYFFNPNGDPIEKKLCHFEDSTVNGENRPKFLEIRHDFSLDFDMLFFGALENSVCPKSIAATRF